MRPAAITSVEVVRLRSRVGWRVLLSTTDYGLRAVIDFGTEDEAHRGAALSAGLHGAKLTNGK